MVSLAPEALADIIRQRAELRAACRREEDSILAALKMANPDFTDPAPFSHRALRALIYCAFMAGAAHEIARPKPSTAS